MKKADMSTETYISQSENQTEEIAAKLALTLRRGTVICLNGDLGAGKTVFSRGFARGLGITEPISSPTYTIVQEYKLAGKGFLYHLDLYRISNSVSALAFGVDEFLNDNNSIALVEWPERITGIIPPGAITVNIRHLSDSQREIEILS